MTTPSEDITDDLSAHAWLAENKVDTGDEVTTSTVDTNLGAQWCNFVDKLLKQASAALRGELEVPALYPRVAADIDFSSLANSGAFADGTVAIDGVNWTARNTSAASTFQVTNGTGLQFVTDGTSGEFNNSSRTAAHIGVAASTLISDFDATGTYLVEAYFPTLTFTSANNRALVGMWRDANQDRAALGGFSFSGSALGAWTQLDASGGQINQASHDCAIVLLSPTGMATYSGAYSSGFPTPANRVSIGTATFGTTSVSSFNVLDPASEFVIAFRTGTTATGMEIDLERLRITRIG